MAVNGKLRKIDYESWSQSELIREIKKLEKRKKYGIVWDEERTKEIFEEEVQHKLPVLADIKSKEVLTNQSLPTNVLIEGDNYHALSVLNYTHKEKVDVIYIDPPYNTGIEGFRFNDKIVDKEDSYRHSKWLTFMSKRLKLAKSLLKRIGIIFISIDDNEAAQLKLLCDEIFGEENFIVNIIWKKRSEPPNDQVIGTTHEYLLCYAKSIQNTRIFRKQRTREQIDRYKNPDNHPKGPWVAGDLMANVKGGRYVKSLSFPIINPKTNKKFYPSSNGNWRFNKETIDKLLANNEIYFGKDGKGRPKLKRFLSDVREGVPFSSIWENVAYNKNATAEIERLFGSVNVFDTPKPTALIKEILNLATNNKEEFTVLDFMAGSGTTGHAVLGLNKEDGGKRRFIIVTNNENGICTEVCYPRIKKAIRGYTSSKNEKIEPLKSNLKYFKTEFIDWSPTDKNKRNLVQKSTEMLCLKEDCFELHKESDHYKIFKNHNNRYLGIIYYYDGIELFKKEVAKLNKEINTYVFSLSDIVDEEEFQEVDHLVNLKPIPASILNVYRRIFAYVQTKKLPREIQSGTNG